MTLKKSRNITSHILSCLVLNLNIKSQDDLYRFMFYPLYGYLLYVCCIYEPAYLS